MPPKVFVTEAPTYQRPDGTKATRFDLSPAAVFGEVLLPVEARGRSPLERLARMREHLAAFTKDDFLLPLGDPGVIATAALLAGVKTGGAVKILVWDRFTKTYAEVHARP